MVKMMYGCKRVVGCALFLLLFPCFAAGALAFAIPERLVFDISWGGIKAGTAIQEVSRQGEFVTITSVTRSADWLSYIYKVDDRIESVMNKGVGQTLFGLPRSYRENIREGRTRRNKDIAFDHANGQAIIDNRFDKSRNTLAITPITYDSLSSFYYARLQKLEPGTSFFIDIFDGKKLHATEVKVVRRELLKIDLGTFRTIVIMPVLQTSGVFNKTGDLYIWLTDDERRIPLRMKSKIKIGSITATLVGGNYWPEKQ
jgi:hypothetical protein